MSDFLGGNRVAGARAFFDARSERWFTHGDVVALTHLVASSLSFPRKALVFCFCRNRIESVIAYLASLDAGHAVLLLDPDLNEEFVELHINRWRSSGLSRRLE